MKGLPGSKEPSRPNRYQDVNAYRKAILSDRGPPKHGTRLVLLAILQFAGPGGVAWPSQRTIAKCAAMSIRSVRAHIKAAEVEHWLTRGPHRVSKGHQWYQIVYFLHTPEQAAETAPCDVKV